MMSLDVSLVVPPRATLQSRSSPMAAAATPFLPSADGALASVQRGTRWCRRQSEQTDAQTQRGKLEHNGRPLLE
jgi:uncharacterized lipoprotein NlpE involved in copper resistance